MPYASSPRLGSGSWTVCAGGRVLREVARLCAGARRGRPRLLALSAAALTFVGGTLAPANAAYSRAAGCFLSEPNSSTLIHTDARCGNIFLSADGVKFIDFQLLKGGPRAAMDVAYMTFQNMGAVDAEPKSLSRLETWDTSFLTGIDHPLANCCPMCCREGLRSSTRRGQVARLPVEYELIGGGDVLHTLRLGVPGRGALLHVADVHRLAPSSPG